LPSIDGGSDGTLVSAASPAPAQPAPAIESGNTGGSLPSMPSTELDDAVVVALREDAAEEAAAPLADERGRGLKKAALLAASSLDASVWALRFLCACACLIIKLLFL
jgi:hypothetical protein